MSFNRGRGRLKFAEHVEHDGISRTVHGPYGELIKSYEFGPFKAGDTVKLDGTFLADRVQWALDFRWEILSLVTNVMNGQQWVDLWGGDKKWAHVFSVQYEALKVDSIRHS